MITNNDPRDFSRLENYFDVIVIDAPCSGSGLFRRDPEAIKEWSEENVSLCSARQQRILADAWPALKKDGILIYSTCSYSKEENEDIIDWIMQEFDVDSLPLVYNDSRISDNQIVAEVISDKHKGYGYQFYPDQVRGEGFFIACLKKNDGAEFIYPKYKRQSPEKLKKIEEELIKQYVGKHIEPAFFKNNDLAYALPVCLLEDLKCIQNALYLRKAGVLAGQ